MPSLGLAMDPTPINGLEVPLFVHLHSMNIFWHTKHNYLIAAMNTELKCVNICLTNNIIT